MSKSFFKKILDEASQLQLIQDSRRENGVHTGNHPDGTKKRENMTLILKIREKLARTDPDGL